MSDKVVIHDVGPRDGLQNQPRILSPGQRVAMIRALLDAGVRHIQAGAMVSPKVVPAMAGTAQVLTEICNWDGIFSILIPNKKGYELALQAGADELEMVLYATDGMARANVGMDAAQVERVTADILASAGQDGARITATISVAFECPFDGPVEPGVVEGLAGRLLDMGAERIVIADTIGAADPGQVARMMARLLERYPADRLACHFHDTRAMGLANVFAALQFGIRRFDSSIAGIGGCPFAPGASGNVATEDIVMMLGQMGFETGIEMNRLLRASALVRELTGAMRGGRATAWLEHQLAKSA